MTMVAMPTGRASAMPVLAAGHAGAAVGKDAGAAAAGQFADVLEQRAQAPGRPATARETEVADRPSTGKRAEARGQGRKDEAQVGLGDGVKTGVVVGAGSIGANSAAGLPVEAAGHTGAAAGVGPEAGLAASIGVARDAVAETSGASGRVTDAAETGAADEVAAEAVDGVAAEAKDGVAARAKDVSDVTGNAAAGSAIVAHAGSGVSPKVVADAVATMPEGLLAGMTASTAPVSGAAAGAVEAAVVASAGSVRQQGSGGKAIQSKASGVDRRSVAGDAIASVPGKDGTAKVGGEAGAQAELAGENGRGQHEGKSDARPAGKVGGEVAETGGHDGGATERMSSGPTQPVLPAATPVQAGAAAMLPVVAMPVEAPHTLAASDRGLAGGAGEAASSGSVGTGSVGPNGGSGVAEAAPLTALGAARLLKTVAGSELRVGTQSADLGAVTIRTVLGRDQMQAHISFENERMGSALSAHLLGGSLEDRLGQSLGMRASVTLSAGADAGTGQSGREAAREDRTGQASGGSGSQAGSGYGSSSGGGSERHGPRTAVGGFGGSGGSAGGSGVSRSMVYGGAAAAEGRLSIRI